MTTQRQLAKGRREPPLSVAAPAPAPPAPGPIEDPQERLTQAFEELHAALVPLIKCVPTGDESSSSLTFRRKIKGDFLQVILQPGKR